MQRWQFGISTVVLLVLLVLPEFSGAAPDPVTPAAGGEAHTWAWNIQTVDSTGNVGEYTSLALDAADYPHISYYGSSDLKLAEWDGSTWTISTLDTAGDVGLFTSLQVWGAGEYGIAYYDATYGDLKYISGGSAGAVDTAGNVGQWSSLALNAQQVAGISYYDTAGRLKYLYDPGGGGPVPEVVDGGAGQDVGRYSSLAFLPGVPQDWPAISYYDATGGNLKYAQGGIEPGKGGETYYWAIATVDSTGDVGQWTSLAFDSFGQPHISYLGGGQVLKHAWRSSNVWYFEVVDTGITGHTSLVMDSLNNPHISYDTPQGLKYAWKEDGSWHTELVDTGNVGTWSSLALDDLGRPCISYRDEDNMDLKLACACLDVAFQHTPAPACVNAPVQFTSEVVGEPPFTYLWTFGDGGTSSQVNPLHAYSEQGLYTTWLTVTAGCGLDTYTDTVTIWGTPQADFTYAPPTFCAGGVVSFTNTSVGSGTLSYQWTFGDGYSSSKEHPTHTYALPGNFQVALLTSNECGNDLYQDMLTAHGGPQVDYSWTPITPEIHLPVTFTAAASSTLPVSYTWDLGDGVTATGEVVEHVYAVVGIYTVTLTGDNGCGLDGLVQTVPVVCYPPTNLSPAWNPDPPTIGFPTTFSAQVEGSRPMTYTWAFGDGASGQGEVVTHTYAATGTYAVAVSATNECGATYTATEVVVVALPTAAFVASSPVCLGEAMVFTNTSGGAEPLAYRWAFGDGATATETNPVHTYVEDGPYTVQLTVSNAYGTGSVTDTVEVWSAPTNASFALDPAFPFPGGVVTFTATADGYPAPAYSWDLGDGYTATGQLVTHTYAVTGVYTVILQAAGGCGTVTTTQDVAVAFCTGPGGLEMAHSTPLLARELAFFTATLASGSALVTYAWDLGDGSPPIYGPAIVSHTYAAGGVFTINVAAWNDCGTIGPLPFAVQVEQTTYYIYLPVVLRAFYPGDQYEPDNTSAQANLLPLATPQGHDFAPEGDVDWVYLMIPAAGTYYMRTFNLGGGADTRLFLYDSGDNLVGSNDDCPGGQPPDHLASCLTVDLVPGRYTLKVDQSPGTPGGMKWGPEVVYTLEATQQ